MEQAGQQQDSFERWVELIYQDEPVEYIGKRIVRKAMPTMEHGSIQGEVYSFLSGHRYPEASGKTGWWLSQEVDMYIGGEGVRPDVVGWRQDRHPVAPRPQTKGPHKGVIAVAPDWVCEVLSPSTASRDLGDKRKAYVRAKVGHYWVIDPVNEVLTVYKLVRGEYGLEMTAGPEAGKVQIPPFAETDFDVSLLFDMARRIRSAQSPTRPPRPRKRRGKGAARG